MSSFLLQTELILDKNFRQDLFSDTFITYKRLVKDESNIADNHVLKHLRKVCFY